MTNPRSLPSAPLLRARFSYDASTGHLRWASGRLTGKLTGQSLGQGYRKVFIDGEQFLAHRVIWKMTYGDEPEFIDHIDGDRSNNVLSNLRSVGKAENRRNSALRRNNSTGAVGVRQRSATLWQARIQANGIDRHLGNFRSAEDAIAARRKAEAELGYSGREWSSTEH